MAAPPGASWSSGGTSRRNRPNARGPAGACARDGRRDYASHSRTGEGDWFAHQVLGYSGRRAPRRAAIRPAHPRGTARKRLRRWRSRSTALAGSDRDAAFSSERHKTVSQELLYEVNDGVGRITFNRPEARNALTFRMYERLAEILQQTEKDTSLKALILTGAGEQAFAAGTDISEFKSFSRAEDALNYEARMDGVLDALERSRVPTIAAIAGACTGGGAAIAVCCDIRIGTSSTRFGMPMRISQHTAIA